MTFSEDELILHQGILHKSKALYGSLEIAKKMLQHF